MLLEGYITDPAYRLLREKGTRPLLTQLPYETGPKNSGPVVTQIIGDTTAESPHRYREGSASALLPIRGRQLAGKYGEERVGLFKRYVAAAEKACDTARMPTMGGAGRVDGINPQEPAWETAMARVRSKLRVC